LKIQLTNTWLRASVVGLFLLGAIACKSTHKEKSAAKKAKHPTTVVVKQTGSNLTQKFEISDDEDDAEKAKRKREKKKPVDQDYLPRGGFR
jgi:hypothetical protein